MNLAKRDWSPEMLKLAGLDTGFFPEWFEPGDVVGYVTAKASEETGLVEGTPVVVGGHDTQFAILGAGVKHGEAVLSSGTWEILSVRSSVFNPSREGFEWGVITEADVEPGLWNPQLLMIASAVLEWVRERFYPELSEGDYDPLVRDASNVQPGSGGLLFIPSFVKDSGPTRKFKTEGTLLGLTLGASRAQVYRAALEGLSCQLKLAVNALIKSTGFQVEAIRVVGGGSKNRLWNQLRADVTGMPISINTIREATVFGAALTAFKGIGVYSSFEEALSAVRVSETYTPSQNRETYISLYEQYFKALNTLKNYYR
jgi:L-fuculokinase